MTRIIFDKWIYQRNRRMHAGKVLLLLDNASSHKVQRELNNVNVVFFSPNMTSTIQPLDAGRYKKLHMRWRMDLIEAKIECRLNVLEAIEFVAESWNSIGGEIIRSCWIKSEVIEEPQVADLCAQNDYRQSSLAFQQDCCDLADIFQKLGVTVSVNDYVEIEDHEQIHEDQEALIEAEVEPAV